MPILGWLQFIASVVDSLAWPAVVAFLLFLLRGQLTGLAQRLEEITLPGAHAKFSKRLEEAKLASSDLGPISEVEGPDIVTSTNLLKIASLSPAAAVLMAFREVETSLVKAAEELELGAAQLPNPALAARSTLKNLAAMRLLPQSSVTLYDSLREARNAAAHVPDRQITEKEAIDYLSQAFKLLQVIHGALSDYWATKAAK